MSKKVTYDELNSLIEKHSSKIDTFYKQGFVNYTGTIIDKPQTPDIEVIAKWVLDNKQNLESIKCITRKNSSYNQNHTGISGDEPITNREEERIAKEMCNTYYEDLGDMFDYQIPLKSTQKDSGVGKIDLVAYNKNSNCVYLLELKKRDSNETLLRCVLEVYTYWKQLNHDKFLADFNKPSTTKIIPAVLVFKDSEQFKQYDSKTYPNVCKLIKELNIKVFTIITKTKYTISQEN